jgi:hypothetical protein
MRSYFVEESKVGFGKGATATATATATAKGEGEREEDHLACRRTIYESLYESFPRAELAPPDLTTRARLTQAN